MLLFMGIRKTMEFEEKLKSLISHASKNMENISAMSNMEFGRPSQGVSEGRKLDDLETI